MRWAFCCGCSAIETGNHGNGAGFVFPARQHVDGRGATATYELIGGRLVMRHASKRSSGTWGPDDYDVIDAQGRDIGRIFKPGAGAPDDQPWMWTITGAVVMPALPSHGFCASLDEAKAKFAETWRAWLALNR